MEPCHYTREDWMQSEEEGWMQPDLPLEPESNFFLGFFVGLAVSFVLYTPAVVFIAWWFLK